MGRLRSFFKQNLQNCITKKLHSKRGMTLVELLSALLILSLVTGGMAAAVSLGTQQYQKSMRDAEAQVLYSTLMTVLSNELMYTTDIRVDDDKGIGNVAQFMSQNYVIEGNLSTLMTDNADGNDYGKLLLGNSKNTDEYMSVLGKASYTRGLSAKVTKFQYHNSEHYFIVELSIGYQGAPYYTKEFHVRSVNETNATIDTI